MDYFVLAKKGFQRRTIVLTTASSSTSQGFSSLVNMLDPEKGDISDQQHVPQDIDGPIEHPGVSTTSDSEAQDEKSNSALDKEFGDSKRHGSLGSDDTSIHSHTSTEVEIDAILESVNNDIPAQQTLSRSSSRIPVAVPVPRSKRRGLLARLTVIPEVDNPYGYKNGTKWFITFQVAIAAAAAPMGSAILLRKYCFFHDHQPLPSARALLHPHHRNPIGGLMSENKRLTWHSSCSRRYNQKLPQHRHNRQPICCSLHVKHVNIPPMVVILQRNPRPPFHLPYLLRALHIMERRLRSFHFNGHAHRDENARRWSCCFCTSSRCRNYC